MKNTSLRCWRRKQLCISSALHIDTETGSRKKLLEDKEYEETVSIYLYTAEGNLDFKQPIKEDLVLTKSNE